MLKAFSLLVKVCRKGKMAEDWRNFFLKSAETLKPLAKHLLSKTDDEKESARAS